MRQFRVVFKSGCTPWLNANDWTIEDMKQWQEFPDYQIEYREVKKC